MSNVTPQVAINKGYTVLGGETITPANPGVILTGLPGTNKIILHAVTNGGQIYLNNDGGTTDGLPLLKTYTVWDGAALVTAFETTVIEIETSTPTDYALYSATGLQAVNVLYLALNT